MSWIEVAEDERGLVVVFRQFGWASVGDILVGGLIGAVAVVSPVQWYVEHGEVDPVFVVLAVVGGLVGAFIGYRGLTGVFNRTTLSVSPVAFEAETGPLPWEGNVRVPVGAAAFLAVDHEVEIVRTDHDLDDYVRPAPTFADFQRGWVWGWRIVRRHHLDLWLDGGRCVRLVSNLPSRALGEEVAQLVNRRLGRPHG